MTCVADNRGNAAEVNGAKLGWLCDDRPDWVLMGAVRSGDVGLYELLIHRHSDLVRNAAVKFSGDLVESDDVAAEVFASFLAILRRGGGPRTSCGAYLVMLARNVVTRERLYGSGAYRYGGLNDLGELADLGVLPEVTPSVGADKITLLRLECELAAAAFRTLPPRWRQVLWALDVEGSTAAVVGRRIGLSANAVSSLGLRAREGLRRAYLALQIRDSVDPRCRFVRDRLITCIRGSSSDRYLGRVATHLSWCDPCRTVAIRVIETNTDLVDDGRITRWLMMHYASP